MGVIIKDPDILGGTPVFRGTRVPVQTLFDYLEGGETLEDFLEGFPTVSRELAIAVLEEARTLLLPSANEGADRRVPGRAISTFVPGVSTARRSGMPSSPG